MSKVNATLRIFTTCGFLGLAVPVVAQDAMFVDSSGNVGVGTNTPSVPLHVLRTDGSANILVQESSGTTATRPLFTLENNGNLRFQMNNTGGNDWAFSTSSAGFSISKVGTAAEALVRNNGDLEILGTLMEGSSRSIKDNIAHLDGQTVLAKLEALTISEWSYSSNRSTRHVGPMAEDFYEVFGLGPDNKHLAPKDIAGVALAAAKALKAENKHLRATVESNQAEVRQLRAELESLRNLVSASRD